MYLKELKVVIFFFFSRGLKVNTGFACLTVTETSLLVCVGCGVFFFLSENPLDISGNMSACRFKSSWQL